MRRCSILLCILLLTGCNAPVIVPERTPVSVPSPEEASPSDTQPAAEVPPSPPRPLGPVDVVLAEADLTGDGFIEDVVITEYGMIRIFSRKSADSLTEIFTYQLPTESGEGVQAQVYPLPGRPPLLRVFWDWCPYGYPDNLFVWHDTAISKLTTDRAGESMGRCGAYTDLGNGRFEAVFRHNELSYTRTETWQDSGLVVESSEAQLIRIEIDRLPDVLEMLAWEEITNPESLFATADLYTQFRAQARAGTAFRYPTSTQPGTLLLQVFQDDTPQGQLKLTYDTETEGKAWTTITHLEWLQ